MKAILIAMLMNASGDITEIREPRAYATEAECRAAASLLSSAVVGSVVRAYCLVPGEME